MSFTKVCFQRENTFKFPPPLFYATPYLSYYTIFFLSITQVSCHINKSSLGIEDPSGLPLARGGLRLPQQVGPDSTDEKSMSTRNLPLRYPFPCVLLSFEYDPTWAVSAILHAVLPLHVGVQFFFLLLLWQVKIMHIA